MTKSADPRIVYVVDGDASVREGLSRLMDSVGLEARPCASVPEFLGQARGTPVGCVLLDVWGARECGMAVRTALKAVAKVLPIIALSASDDPIARRLAKEMGAHSFFHKPVDGAALLDSIEWAIHSDRRGAPE